MKKNNFTNNCNKDDIKKVTGGNNGDYIKKQSQHGKTPEKPTRKKSNSDNTKI